jgi:hypothetical protein
VGFHGVLYPKGLKALKEHYFLPLPSKCSWLRTSLKTLKVIIGRGGKRHKNCGVFRIFTNSHYYMLLAFLKSL